MKSDRGITLIALIMTIAILIIIASVSISAGMEALNSTRLKGFYTQLEIVQKRVDDIAATNESYIDEIGNTIYLKEQGIAFEDLNQDKQSILINIIAYEGGDVLAGYITNFRYFTSEELETILGIPNIDYNVFIDFENRIIIAEQGIEIDGKTYYMLESATYFVKGDFNNNIGDIDFTIEVVRHGNSKYKITVIPSENIGDLQETGTVKYKEISTKYWETSKNMEIIVEDIPRYYDIIYQDTNKSVQKAYGIIKNEDGEVEIRKLEKIYTPEELLKITSKNITDDTMIVLMNDIKLEETTDWTPIGEIESLKGKFDGNDYSIKVTYADDGNYTIEYNESNNYSEPEYTINVIPKLEDKDGNQIEFAEAVILKNGKSTGKLGKQEIKIKRATSTEICTNMNSISYEDTKVTVEIKNPKNINDIELVVKYKYATITVNAIVDGNNTDDAVLKINEVTSNNGTAELVVVAGTTVNYSISKEHYYDVPLTSVVVNQDLTLNIDLEPKLVTFTIDPTPSEAVVTINGKITNSLEIIECSEITWSVNNIYYYGQSGTHTMGTIDYSQEVILEEKPTQELILDVSSASQSGSVKDIEKAADGVSSTDYAWAWLGSDRTVTMNFTGFDNIDQNAKIVSMSAEFKLDATLSPYFNANLIAGTKTCGTFRKEFNNTGASEFTVTANDLPTASEVKSATSLAITFEETSAAAIGYWYGATLTIQYIQP